MTNAGAASGSAAGPDQSGLYAGFGAYAIWGLMPVFIKLLQEVTPEDVLAHRILWSAAVMAAACLLTRRGPAILSVLRTPKLLGWLLLSAGAIGINWYIYTWAVLSAHVLDTSLGYFIQPLFNTLFGVVLLKEKLNRWHVGALSLAAVAITILVVRQGGLPLVALGLPLAFSIYSLARNRAETDAVTGLFVETAILAPIALWWLVTTPPGVFGEPAPLMLILMSAGIVTSVPLALFGHAARRLSLTLLGFMQYIAPSLVFLLGVFAYGEAMEPVRFAAFAFVWAGLAVFTVGEMRLRRQRRMAADLSAEPSVQRVES